jgi:ACS family allantoate permease-like MFS transporter
MPSGGFQIASVLVATYSASRIRKSRIIIIIIGYIFALLGILLVKELPTENKLGRLFGYWMMILFSSAFPLMLSLIASNTAGFTKKATVNAMFFISYCAGNIGGPQLFKSAEAPSYPVRFLSQKQAGQILMRFMSRLPTMAASPACASPQLLP